VETYKNKRKGKKYWRKRRKWRGAGVNKLILDLWKIRGEGGATRTFYIYDNFFL